MNRDRTILDKRTYYFDVEDRTEEAEEMNYIADMLWDRNFEGVIKIVLNGTWNKPRDYEEFSI